MRRKAIVGVMSTLFLVSVLTTTLTINATSTNWTKVSLSGFGDSNNWEMEFMAVFKGCLYVGTGNWVTGGEVWRSFDGTTWTQVSENGFGNPNNVEVFFFPGAVLNGYLYAGTGNEAQGGEVYRSSDGINWTWIFDVPSWDDIEVFPTTVFDGHLYVGSLNRHAGGRIWRSSNGVDWTQVNVDGFGNSNNAYTIPLAAFDGYLYAVGGNAWETGPEITGVEIWRSIDGVNWTQVNINGFGDENNSMAFPATVLDDHLYLGTINEVTGGEVWRTGNGTDWTQVNADGFGAPDTIWAFTGPVFDDSLYIGTANWISGGEVWRSNDGTEWILINTNGFGDVANEKAFAGTVFNDYLYAGTYNELTGGEIWRYYCPSVGGTAIPINTLGILAPYIISAALIISAVAATTLYVKRKKNQ